MSMEQLKENNLKAYYSAKALSKEIDAELEKQMSDESFIILESECEVNSEKHIAKTCKMVKKTAKTFMRALADL
jgi:hypothetical protein